MDNETIKAKKENNPPIRKVDLSGFYQRNDNLLIRKKQLYQEAEELKFEEEKKERKNLKSIRYYRPSPISSPKKTNDYWDEDGNLIHENIHTNSHKKQTKETDFNPNRKKENRKKEFDSFLERNLPRNNRNEKKEHQKTISSQNDFNSFLKRQEESAKNRNKEQPLPKQKSYICKKSSQLAAKASRTPLKNEISETEYSFRPDLSKTIKYPANKIPYEISEAKTIIKNFEIDNIRKAKDEEQMKECTFTPITNYSKSQSEKVHKKSESSQKVKASSNQSPQNDNNVSKIGQNTSANNNFKIPKS